MCLNTATATQAIHNAIGYPPNITSGALDLIITNNDWRSRHRFTTIRKNRGQRTSLRCQPHFIYRCFCFFLEDEPQREPSRIFQYLRPSHLFRLKIGKSRQNIGHHPQRKIFVCPDSLSVRFFAEGNKLVNPQPSKTDGTADRIRLPKPGRLTEFPTQGFSGRKIPTRRPQVFESGIWGGGKRAIGPVRMVEPGSHIYRVNTIGMKVVVTHGAGRIYAAVSEGRTFETDEFLRCDYPPRTLVSCPLGHYQSPSAQHLQVQPGIPTGLVYPDLPRVRTSPRPCGGLP